MERCCRKIGITRRVPRARDGESVTERENRTAVIGSLKLKQNIDSRLAAFIDPRLWAALLANPCSLLRHDTLLPFTSRLERVAREWMACESWRGSLSVFEGELSGVTCIGRRHFCASNRASAIVENRRLSIVAHNS